MTPIKYLSLLPVILGTMLLNSCKKETVSYSEEDLANPVSIFPAPPSTWLNQQGSAYYSTGYVGDAMPFFENGAFHLYYLHDGDGNGGYHPIHEFTSTDLLHYNYKGRTLPFGGNDDQDRAIGTGSIIKSGSTYYFYYTGHNDLHWGTGEPVEGIMYATSTDLTNWTKHSGFVLYPSTADGYAANDFRDPFIYYNQAAGEYWMLLSAIKNGIPVIALYSTTNLASDNWVLKSPFYTADNAAYGIMECPDLFKLGDKWYLLFSENGVNRTTHYRMATSLNGPWLKPNVDVLDGAHFYAAKSASDGTNRYLFGWAYRKAGESDYGANIWGGNLVTHQLLQNSEGTLAIKSPDAVSNLISINKTITQLSSQNTTANGNNYSLQADGFTAFSLINGQKKITTTLKGLQTDGDAGFAFGYGRPGNGDYYKLRLKNGVAYLLKVQGANEYIDCSVPFGFTPGNDITVEIIVDNNLLVTTINGKTTLTGRSYWMPNAQWGIYSKQAGVSFNELKLFGY